MKQISNIVFSTLALLLVMTGCDKTKLYDVTKPESLAHFANTAGATLNVLTATSSYKVAIGVTTVSDVDRTVAFTVTSPTGAVLGTHYSLSKTIATIKAGQATDSIEVRGVLAQYTGGRKDTLLFTITDPTVKTAAYNPTFKLFLRGPCFEGDTDLQVLNSLRGDYTKTNENFGGSLYGPYKTTITAVSITGPKQGRITVTNIFDGVATWGPISFNLDWSNPLNRTAIVVDQPAVAGSNAGELSATYAGQTVAVRAFAGSVGTFSACNSTFSLTMDLGVTGLGFFGTLYTVNMAR